MPCLPKACGKTSNIHNSPEWGSIINCAILNIPCFYPNLWLSELLVWLQRGSDNQGTILCCQHDLERSQQYLTQTP